MVTSYTAAQLIKINQLIGKTCVPANTWNTLKSLRITKPLRGTRGGVNQQRSIPIWNSVHFNHYPKQNNCNQNGKLSKGTVPEIKYKCLQPIVSTFRNISNLIKISTSNFTDSAISQ